MAFVLYETSQPGKLTVLPDGVTEFEALENAPTPAELMAATLNV
jgi:hypothetical protein